MTECERLDCILKDRKLSRRRLALEVGIPPSSFQSAMERNDILSLDMLVPICHYLDISIDDIRYGNTLEEFGPAENYCPSLNEATGHRGHQLPDKIIRAWKAAERKEGKKLSFDEAMSLYRIETSSEPRMFAAFHRLNMEGRKIAIERVEELTLIDKYTLPMIENAEDKTIPPEPKE